MAEDSGSRYPRHGMGYFNASYSLPSLNYPSIPLATYQPSPQDVFMSPLQRGIRYPQYQDNTQFTGSSHLPSNTYYEANAHYHGNNQYRGNVPFQDRTNMQYQASYMMQNNPGAHMTFDNSCSNFTTNNSSLIPNLDYQSESSGQFNHGQHSVRHGHSMNMGMNYNDVFKTGQGIPLAKESSGASSVVSPGKTPPEEKRNVEKCPNKSIDFHSDSHSFKRESSVNGSAAENNSLEFSVDNDNHGNSIEGGVKSKGPPRGRGGRGRRGGRRSYGDRSSQGYSNTQNSNNSFGWYSVREDDADEKKRDRDTALAETAAFMKNMNMRKGDNGNRKEENGHEKRTKGSQSRQDLVMGHPGSNRRQQRDYFGKEKQGKEWMNRQVRTENEKGYNEMNNIYYEQTNGQDKPQRNDRSSNRGQGNRQNYLQDGNKSLDNGEHSQDPNMFYNLDVSKIGAVKQLGSAKPVRGRGRGRQDKRLWSNGEGNSSPGSDPGTRNARKENMLEKEDSSAVSSSIVIGNKEDEESQRDRLTEQLMKGTYECMVCCDPIKQQHAIWSCESCYNCFHLGCIKKWAKSSTGDAGWRCPACQGSTPKVPNAYRCFCGKMREPEWNRRDIAHSCGEICGRSRVIDWCKHKCNILCHPGPCPPCTAFIKRSCPCGAKFCEVKCSITEPFLCDGVCGKLLNCEGHKCEKKCHTGPCGDCQQQISQRCHCGKNMREVVCTQETFGTTTYGCGCTCCHTLECGNHQCEAECHPGDCQPCKRAVDTITHCPCGKMRQCSRHKCNTKCCIDIDHLCTLVCGRMLSCGLHKCWESCHRGKCPRCLHTSFEELTCHCGASVIYPPVPCGTKPPCCENPCQRPQNCHHEATHPCHPDESCPPCTVFVDKPCYGNHKVMLRTLCYLSGVSCGALCGRPLPCGLHKCQRVCHEQPCVPEGTFCTQKCVKLRESCGHPCNSPCHTEACPDTSCKEMVKISCECGHRKATLQCSENDREYRTLATSMLASQMQNMNSGCSVDLTDIFTATARPDKLKRLACSEECQTEERNRRLALALQIENPEAREKLGNSCGLYSDFMKEEARKDPNLAKMVHDALTDLVMKVRESKQKSCIHSFPSMNREKRQFVHEYCEHFGCQSQSYDEEPKKNVVATAVRGMCYLPPLSVLTLIQREQGQRKVPAPIWTRISPLNTSRQGMQKLEKSTSIKKETDSSTKPPPIDYFDFDE
ncbi:protein shuttle craft [Panulirus ornatus]|uniref:protein shuttle craft n=1 Tax=Panulirus ornatus TaxID=150431 RepID=UPI003A88E2DC